MILEEILEIGRVYSRSDLARQFKIVDQKLYHAVFQPADSASLWLFVGGGPSYRSEGHTSLDGDDLRMVGQARGRNDELIVSHGELGLRLLVFYRDYAAVIRRSGFRFEGPFQYLSHSGSSPALFHLRRIAPAQPTPVERG